MHVYSIPEILRQNTYETNYNRCIGAYRAHRRDKLRGIAVATNTDSRTTILVAGGAGYIGTHTLICLYKAGYKAVCVDNLANSSREALVRTGEIIGEEIPFYELDIRDNDGLNKVFDAHQIDGVINFAGLKAVGESVSIPVEYYDDNINTTLSLIRAMKAHDCHVMIFSSSATVYGMNNESPLTEGMPTSATNPYGWTKVMNEQILRDVTVADPEFSVVLLRYFNPIGAHESGRIGENPKGIPNNLMPYITQVAVGKLEKLHIFGNDYPTPDGTGVRDYIHVMDLGEGHVQAIDYAMGHKGAIEINLGTSHGISVLELVHAFEKNNGVEIPYVIDPRRPGDIATVYADASRAHELLGWSARRDVNDMVRDSWTWQSNNPRGYEN